jgi:hypothetical protein
VEVAGLWLGELPAGVGLPLWQLADSGPQLWALVDQPGVPAAMVWSIWQRRAGCEQVGNRQLRSRVMTWSIRSWGGV